MAQRATPRTRKRRVSLDDRVGALVDNVSSVLHGKDDVVRLTVVCMLARGHLLVEDVPGVGKTTLAKALARSVDGSWHRIQFTPDLLPSDVTGVSVFNQRTEEFEFRPGPIFSHFTLADEINRASPRTQAALLEAMQERQVTADGETHPLDEPFMVIATQNPIEHEGTYTLPEAQLDRFLMRVRIGYPERDAAVDMLDDDDDFDGGAGELKPVLKVRDVVAMSREAAQVRFAPALQHYLLDLVDATRAHQDLVVGISPRGAKALQRAARAYAAADGRDFVLPDDVKLLAEPVWGHRLLLTPEAELHGADSATVLEEILDKAPVPHLRKKR